MKTKRRCTSATLSSTQVRPLPFSTGSGTIRGISIGPPSHPFRYTRHNLSNFNDMSAAFLKRFWIPFVAPLVKYTAETEQGTFVRNVVDPLMIWRDLPNSSTIKDVMDFMQYYTMRNTIPRLEAMGLVSRLETLELPTWRKLFSHQKPAVAWFCSWICL